MCALRQMCMLGLTRVHAEQRALTCRCASDHQTSRLQKGPLLPEAMQLPVRHVQICITVHDEGTWRSH